MDGWRVWLVAAETERDGRQSQLSRLRVLEMVCRRSLPTLIEATLIPSVIFYGFLVTIGPGAAMLAALACAYGAALRRAIRGQRIPAVLQLALIGLTLRTIVGLVIGTFLYFVQPIATTVGVAFIFLISSWAGRPMIARLAADFCPLHPEVAARPAVVRLFRGLTFMWAGVHFLSAGTTLALLLSVPTATFAAARDVGSLALTLTAVAFTVSWSMRTARSEDLILVPVAARSD